VALSTYLELQNSILDWIVRPDLAALAPDWIRLLEARVEQELTLSAQVTQFTGTLVAGTATLSLPADCSQIENVYLSLDPRGALQYVTPQQLVARRDASVGGQPRVYTSIGAVLQFAPIPDAAYAYVLSYYATLPALSVADTNWLLQHAPGVYLYGSLVEAALYTQDDQAALKWEALYRRATSGVVLADEQGKPSGSVLRVRNL